MLSLRQQLAIARVAARQLVLLFSISLNSRGRRLMELMGQRLKQYRTSKGFTAVKVARKLGIAISTYRRWEEGAMISGEPYVKLANIFGVSLHELFGLETSRKAILDDISEIERLLERIKLFA
jgi:transcriptional regulator with XRE-family HTH domain